MNYRFGSLFQRNAHSLSRRLYFLVLRRITGVFGKRQSVYFVDINGHRYKRVVFGDSLQSTETEQALAQFDGAGCFPNLIERHENELLLEFVEARRFDPDQSADRQLFEAFLATLWSHEATHQAPTGPAPARQLAADLHFLARSGVIDDSLAGQLQSLGERTTPGTLWLGFDYLDPVAKNFVVEDGHLVAVDVESLRPEAMLGTGLVQAAVHWLDRDEVPGALERIHAAGAPDLAGQIRFVELAFRVAWTKRKLLQGKRHAVKPELLEELVRRSVK